MKIFLTGIALIFTLSTILAQTAIPKDYVKGSVTLMNGTVQNGFIKEKIKKSASVQFINETGQNKKTFEGQAIQSVQIENTKYLCIKGDFFKLITSGKINFLQKESNASGKIIYSNNEPIGFYGTDGAIKDFYIYHNNTLQLVSKKNLAVLIDTELKGCNDAIVKANSINGNIAQLQEAVEIYNNFSK